MLNRDCWNFTTVFRKCFVTLTSLKNLRWTQTPSTWLYRKKIWKTCFCLKSETSRMRFIRKIAQTLSLPLQHTIWFRECVATHTRNTIGVNQVSLRKMLEVQKCCVYGVKHSEAMIERVTSIRLAAKVNTNEVQKTVAMDQCQNIAKNWTNLSMSLQPTEGFEQINTARRLMN